MKYGPCYLHLADGSTRAATVTQQNFGAVHAVAFHGAGAALNSELGATVMLGFSWAEGKDPFALLQDCVRVENKLLVSEEII